MTPSTPIETIEQLKEYLYVAMQLEHATIPPYLAAMYTAKEKENGAVRKTIFAVALEEMLHLTLAANLLNAIGGAPNFLREGFVPSYPCHLPDGETDFAVGIAMFSESTIDTFLDIERPTPPAEFRKAAAVFTEEGKIRRVELPCTEKMTHEPNSLLSEDGKIKYVEKKDLQPDTRGKGRGLLPAVEVTLSAGVVLELHYWSIGEFYNAVRNGLRHLAGKPEPLFTGDPSRQIPPKDYFSGGGELTEITNLDTAIAAIDLISTQGEGYTDEISDMGEELAHYYRFEQIKKRKYYLENDHPGDPRGDNFPVVLDAVFPIKQNAKIADYNDYPDIEREARLFNGYYRQFLHKLNVVFNGKPHLFREALVMMPQIRNQMERLIKNELTGTGENAAPTFEMNEYIDPPINPSKDK